MNKTKLNMVLCVSFFSVIGMGTLIIALFVEGISRPYEALFLVILCIVAESLAISIGNNRAVSVSFAIVLIAVLAFEPATAALISGLGVLLRVIYVKGRGYVHIFNTPPYKSVFNVSNYALSTLLSVYVYRILGGTPITASDSMGGVIQQMAERYFLIFILVFVFHFTNTMILTRLISIIMKNNFLNTWFRSALWTIPNQLAVACLGLIITAAYLSLGPFSVLLFFGPLVLARYSFKLYMDMKSVYLETINALAFAIEAKDKYTEGHSRRVEKFSELIATQMGYRGSRIDTIKYAALLHDIGKIGVAESILNKEDKLLDPEYDIVKKHPIIGSNILKDVDFLKKEKNIVLHHHERFDGKGYPDGLAGEDIPDEARIMAVADAFDAMTSDRPYRKAMTIDRSLGILLEEAGRQFDPVVVAAFEKVIKSKREIVENVR